MDTNLSTDIKLHSFNTEHMFGKSLNHFKRTFIFQNGYHWVDVCNADFEYQVDRGN